MIDCKMALKNLFDYLDKELDKKDTEEFERHVELCRKCYDRFDFEKALKDRIRKQAGRGQASPKLLKRIASILEKFGK